MGYFVKSLVTAAAVALLSSAANANPITWNFGTSSYSLVNPSGGPDAANASGTTGAITANGQGAVFLDTSNTYSVTASAYATNNSPQPNTTGTAEKVTQSNNYSVTANGNTSTLTGIGACNSSCTGVLTAIGDTEMIGISLGSHPVWNLTSIEFENFLFSPSAGEVFFWFSNSANGASPQDTKELPSPTACSSTGADGSCTYNLSGIADPDLNSYAYLFVTAVNFNGTQPAIEVTQLVGQTNPVPEPNALSLFGAGLLLLGFARRRKRTA